MSSFTYIISSRDDVSDVTRASSCYIQIGGFPEGIRYFRCRVLSFTINNCSLTNGWMGVGSSHYMSLVCDNLIVTGARSGNKDLNIITTYSVDCPMRVGEVFNIINPNGKTFNFRLNSEHEIPITPVINQNAINTVWTLTLELTPIGDCC